MAGGKSLARDVGGFFSRGWGRLTGRGKKRPCNCFIEGTEVETKEGLRAIEEIEVGDWVAAKDEVTGEVAWKPVVELFEFENREIYELTLMDQKGIEEIIGVTSEHPFRVLGGK